VLVLFIPLIVVAPDALVIGVIVAAGLWVAPLWNAGIVGYRTAIAPDRLQGRVQGAASLLAQGASSLGQLATGVALAQIGSHATVFCLAGIACVLAVPSLSTSGETRMIEELMTLRARTESAGHVGDKHERSWCWSLG